MSNEINGLWCSNCSSKREAGSIFCPICGNKLASQPEMISVPEEHPPTENQIDSSPASKSRGKRILAFSVAFFLLVGLGALGVTAYNERLEEERLAVEAAALAEAEAAALAEAEEQQRRLEAESLLEAFGESTVAASMPACEKIGELVYGDAEKWEKVTADFKGVTEPRKAASLLDSVRNKSGELRESEIEVFQETFYSTVDENLEEIYQVSDRDELAPSVQLQRWNSEWRNLVDAACPSEFEAFNESYGSLQASKREFSRVTTLASQVPWYPDGFSEYGTNLAFKWTSREGSWPCTGCSFWKLTVVTKLGCPNSLYGEMNITRGGAVVDWTNDRIASLRAGEKAVLTFIEYPYNSNNSGRLTELTCR